MSVSEETLELMKAAIRNGTNPDGTLVRSKLTNMLVWKSAEHDADDPYLQCLVPALFTDDVPVLAVPEENLQQQLLPPVPVPLPLKAAQPLPVPKRGGRTVLGEIQAPNGQTKKPGLMATGEKIGMSMKPQTAIATSVAKHEKENKLNWQDQWELLKKSGQFCNFCKKNKELREIYQSHDLKGPDGTVTCPVLKRCVCQCCGEQGHTIAYCPRNASGTSILQMINHHNRL
ncbi:uncharacterized protein LOC6041205 [Culex quinquefasciatus]|uniref:uncharacterized protein LOC6041205 n=1 Tax=Culex quinquefasciatus TaxID=7176 RepID=UPI0018E2FBC1|nr:uncharacterized protein LOC6041205 [Culex quinquefasciatus]